MVPSLATAQTLDFGVVTRGRIDNTQPRTAYTFEGLRGDVISLSVEIVSGDLEPIFFLTDSSGRVINVRDEAPGRNVRISSFLVPVTDTYSVVLTRFGDRIGTTAGEYTLNLTRVGVSSQQGSVLRYGDSVYNAVDDVTPQIFYSFQAARGDVISIQMQRASGDLDSTLQLVNSRSEVVAENDDRPGSTDAAISGYTIREDGVYVIIASRYGDAAGESQGAFVLTLTAGAESGLGGSVEFSIPLQADSPVRGRISDVRDVQFYRFEGRQGDRVTLRMNRLDGDIDPLVVIATAAGRELIEDDDTGGGQNAAIIDFELPIDGTYLVLATRFQRAQGTTAGEYEISLSGVP